MAYTNINLTLERNGDSQTITSSQVVKDSFKQRLQLMKDLTPSSSKCSLQLTKDCPATSWILSKNDNISVQVKEGSTVIFTGYLSDRYSWKVGATGEKVFDIVVEDVGTKLLSKAYAPSNGPAVLLNNSVYDILLSICARTGITYNASNVPISTSVIKNVDAGTSCKTILDRMLFECGYTYYFNAAGQFTLYKIAVENQTATYTLDKDDLVVHSSEAISLNKSLLQYRQAKVSYDKTATKSGALVYQDISGRDVAHPNCFIEVEAGYAYPSLMEIGSNSDDLLTAKTEVQDITNGKEILYVADVAPDIVHDGGISIPYSITQYSPTVLNVLYKNTSASKKTITKLQATADICYIESRDKVIAGITSNDDKMYEFECEYIHTKAAASALANLIAQYYTNSNYEYTFFSYEDIPLGAIVQLNENEFSNLSAKILVMQKETNRNLKKYVGVSIAPFNLDAETYHEEIKPAPVVIPGEPGEAVSSGSWAAEMTNVIQAGSDFIASGTSTDPHTFYNDQHYSSAYVTFNASLTNTTYTTSHVTMGFDSNPAGILSTADIAYGIQIVNNSSGAYPVFIVNGVVTDTFTASDYSLDTEYKIEFDDLEVRYYIAGALYKTVMREETNTLYMFGFMGAAGDRAITVTHGNLNQAQMYTLTCNKTFIERDTRSTNSTTYTFTVAILGYTSYTPKLIVNGSDETNNIVWSLSNKRGTYSVVMPRRNSYELEAILYDSNNMMDYLKLDVVDNTGSWANLGTYISDPLDINGLITAGKYINEYPIEGDTYLKNVTTTVGSETTTTSTPMVFSAGVFTSLSGQTSLPEYDEKLISLIANVFANVEEGINHVTIPDYDFFKNIVAKHISAEYIGAQKIRVTDNGAIFAGGYNENGDLVDSSAGGFHLGANGELKANKGEFNNLTIKSDSTFEGTIESEVLKTNLQATQQGDTYTASSSTHNPVAFLNSQLITFINNRIPSIAVSGTRYSTTGSIGGKTITGAVYYSSTPTSSVRIYSSGSFNSNGARTIVNIGSSPVARRVTVTGKAPVDSSFVHDYNRPAITVYNSGVATVVSPRKSGSEFWAGSIGNWGPKDEQFVFSVTFDIKPGGSFYVTMGGESYTLNDTSGYVNINENISAICSTGLNLFETGNMRRYTVGELLPGTYGTSTPSLLINGSRPWYWTVSNASAYPSGINPLYSFQWNIAPTSTGTSSTFYTTPTYTFVNSSGTTVKPAVRYVNWDTGSIKANGDSSALLSHSIYVRSYTVSITLAEAFKGVYLSDTYAMGASPSIGTSQAPFGNIVGVINNVSLRARKENIEDYEGDALSILNDTQICSFNYKDDPHKIKHYGFIADDTAEELATPNHDVMDSTSCTGLLIKAVQQLTARIQELENNITN